MTYLKKYFPFIFLGLIFLTTIFTFSFLLPKVYATTQYLLSPLPEENIVLGTSDINKGDNTSVPFALKRKINILILGLDGRIGDNKPRCDAIHMLTIDNKNRTILITSLPRGTAMKIPQQDKESSYIANACHILGIEKTKAEIEKMLKIKSDYTVKAGFSQVMGILRTFKLPTTETLQFLRNRSVAFGDNQRSRNQGLFIKNMIVNRSDDFNKIPKPLVYFLYKTVETDLPFDLLYQLMDNLKESDFAKHPEKITVIAKTPVNLSLTNKLFDNNEIDKTDPENNPDEDFQTYQNKLQEKIDKIIADAKNLYSINKKSACYEIIKTPFEQKIWLQIEDNSQRYKTEFEMLKSYTDCSPDNVNLSSLILDYNNEMEIENQTDYQKKGEDLLNAYH